MAVKGQKAVAVVYLDRLAAQARVAVGVQPVRQDDDSRGGGRHRLIREPVVVAVMPVVIEVVVPGRRLCVAGSKRRVWASHLGRGPGAVVTADCSIDPVIGVAVIE